MSSRAWQVQPFWGFSLTHPLERAAWSDEVRRNGGNTIEVGTYMGVSAAELARAVPECTIFSIDTQEGNHTRHMIGDAYSLNRQPNMRLWVGTLPQMIDEVGVPPNVRTICLDGDHLIPGCEIDMIAALRLPELRSILLHDYTCLCFADTIRVAAQRQLVPAGWNLKRTVDTTAVFRRDQAS